MNLTAKQLLEIIERYRPALEELEPGQSSFKPSPVKWSKKEIIGHLIDSAQSNIRRFVISQYEDRPHIVYNQDKWVLACGYQDWEIKDLIALWYLLNKQIAAILDRISVTDLKRECLTQDIHTIEWLAEDYIKHLLHHLHHVLELEPVAYP